MADSLINGLTRSEHIKDEDLFPIWKNDVNQTRAISWKDLNAGNSNVNPYRPIIFAFSANNKQSILIKKGTSFKFSYQNIDYVKKWNSDTIIDLSAKITQAGAVASERTGQINGRVFFIFLDTTGDIIVSTQIEAPNDIDSSYTAQNTKLIGFFSTLCVNAGSDLRVLFPVPHGAFTGDTVLVKEGYKYENLRDDYGFLRFYTCPIISINSGSSQYDALLIHHPLEGFNAGDILPESIFCLGFMPCAINSVYSSANKDVLGMVYDINIDKAIDIYLQSGISYNTVSKFGAIHTVNRQQQNFQDDQRCVCKSLLSDEEFYSASLGSRQRSSIQGLIDVSTVGGHSDNSGNRMISSIGCEEMCGYLWQWLRNTSANGGANYTIYDGEGFLGQINGASYALIAGGKWASEIYSGSRCLRGDLIRSITGPDVGARGSSKIMLY